MASRTQPVSAQLAAALAIRRAESGPPIARVRRSGSQSMGPEVQVPASESWTRSGSGMAKP